MFFRDKVDLFLFYGDARLLILILVIILDWGNIYSGRDAGDAWLCEVTINSDN